MGPKRSATYGQLLLFAALLFGIFTAVLGAWGVTLLAVWLMALRPADHRLRAAGAPLLRFLRSFSPPAMTAHGRSSVLRI
ncbi:hypothetical protein OHA33_12520 [Streptomyces sp. NBC_00562]|uniref:hypothetical protein n=1 Tax=Streptomyces sp. NBC_00562 TaxID=2975777 RepID=UPI002E80CB5F|nr:hypothetical protein [Streptomyces sp. NBC_00562]WUC19629.1 hypothetical protein OHA33_12520 [Streptomyces sp. NBC_00562]